MAVVGSQPRSVAQQHSLADIFADTGSESEDEFHGFLPGQLEDQSEQDGRESGHESDFNEQIDKLVPESQGVCGELTRSERLQTRQLHEEERRRRLMQRGKEKPERSRCQRYSCMQALSRNLGFDSSVGSTTALGYSSPLSRVP